MTGFFEESAGVRSMSRLAIAAFTALAAVMVGIIGMYVYRTNDKANAAVITALVGGLTAIVAKGAVALWTRNSGSDAKEEA